MFIPASAVHTEYRSAVLPAEFLNGLSVLFSSGDVLTDPVDCYAYSYDNSRRYSPPQAVVFAHNADQVQRLLLLCNEYRVPVTARGRGTGTAGASVPDCGGVVLSLERMRKIVKIDPANRVLVTQPGVLNEELQAAAKPHGFFWVPDPSSAAYCTVGGNIATCAAGPRAVKYGTTREHVLGLEAVTGKGNAIKTGCYTTKGVVGYDLTRLLIGSEGTLAVVTEATLKLTPLPAAASGLTAHYRDAESCARAIAAIMAQPHTPSALEFLDRGSLELIRNRYPDMLPEQTKAMLIIEADGSATEVANTLAAIAQSCANPGLLSAEKALDAAALWAVRRALSPLLRDIAPRKINEDVVVPVSRLPELLDGLAALSTRYQLANVNFGHAGNGNIHVNLLIDPEVDLQRAQVCLEGVFDLVLSLNGTLSGEHGIGREKRQYVAKEIDGATLALMKDIKTLFDPAGILNPGKLFP
ncbi:MAG: FAD-binding oxidoreductase [Burkholderiales bacterium]